MPALDVFRSLASNVLNPKRLLGINQVSRVKSKATKCGTQPVMGYARATQRGRVPSLATTILGVKGYVDDGLTISRSVVQVDD